MSRHKRLRLAREKHFATAKDAAASLGVPYGTYSGHEAGTRGFKEEELKLYARRFKVPVEWLYFGMQEFEDFGKTEVDVFGFLVGADGLIQKCDRFDDKIVRIDFQVPMTSMAIIVKEKALWPRYDIDDLIIFDENALDYDEIGIGEEVVVHDVDGRVYMTFIEEGSTKGTVIRTTHMSPRSLESVVSKSAGIVLVLRRGCYRLLSSTDLKVPVAIRPII